MPQADGADALAQEAVEGLHPAVERQGGRKERDDERKSQELAEQTFVEALGARSEMSGLMVTVNAFDGPFVAVRMVSVHRRRDQRRQEYRQQQNGNYASLQFHRAAKIDNSSKYRLPKFAAILGRFWGKCYICGKFLTSKKMQEQEGKYIFGVVKVGDKGQIVIPRDARNKYGIKPGDALLMVGDERGMALVKTEIFQSAVDQVMEGLSR